MGFLPWNELLTLAVGSLFGLLALASSWQFGRVHPTSSVAPAAEFLLRVGPLEPVYILRLFNARVGAGKEAQTYT